MNPVAGGILKHFAENGLETEPADRRGRPACGQPALRDVDRSGTRNREGDFVLIDLWAKLETPAGVYSDLTRVGFMGKTVPAKYDGNLPDRGQGPRYGHRNGSHAFAERRPIAGCEVDRASRHVIAAGRLRRSLRPSHGAQHRPGDARQRCEHRRPGNARHPPPSPHLLFIEPGIYLPEFGVRSEVTSTSTAAARST